MASGVDHHHQDQNMYWYTLYKINDILSPRESKRFDIDDEASKDVELTKDEVVIPDKKLTLLSGNMDAEAEISVRSFLLSRMNQWFIKGETESITTSMEIESKQIQLYSKGIFSKQSFYLTVFKMTWIRFR